LQTAVKVAPEQHETTSTSTTELIQHEKVFCRLNS